LTEGGKPPDERVYEGEPVPGESEERPRGQLVRAEVFYTGPLPNAAEMERYERTLPGAADRIVAMSESEEDHRHRIENRGQVLAAALPIFFVTLGAVVFLISGSGQVWRWPPSASRQPVMVSCATWREDGETAASYR
jgi:hypothetical protein